MHNYSLLSDKELFEHIIMEKRGGPITESVFQVYSELSYVFVDSDDEELLTIKGLGEKRLLQIKAVEEIARRLYCIPSREMYKIRSPQDVADLLIPEMKYLKQEHLRVILLNAKNTVIGIETSSIGSLNSTIISPREIYKTAIRKSSASIILAHNHPSGDPTPSIEDLEATRKVKQAGELLGIPLLDHIVIGGTNSISMQLKGLL